MTEARVAGLLRLEVERLVATLHRRRRLLLGQWGFHRDRRVFLLSLHTRWTSLGAEELLGLPDDTLRRLDRFYDELDDFRRYVATTEDMDESMERVFDETVASLDRLGADAVRALERVGGARSG